MNSFNIQIVRFRFVEVMLIIDKYGEVKQRLLHIVIKCLLSLSMKGLASLVLLKMLIYLLVSL